MKEIVCSVIVLLGIDLSVSSITSDLKSYKDNNINRYVIRDELLGNILDDYFDVGNYIQSYSLKPLKGCKFSN